MKTKEKISESRLRTFVRVIFQDADIYENDKQIMDIPLTELLNEWLPKINKSKSKVEYVFSTLPEDSEFVDVTYNGETKTLETQNGTLIGEKALMENIKKNFGITRWTPTIKDSLELKAVVTLLD